MSKLTFRADDDLVARLEEFDGSKSEVLRRALREYIERHATSTSRAGDLDALLTERIDERLAEHTPEVTVHVGLGGTERQEDTEQVREASVDAPRPSHGPSNGLSHEGKTESRGDENTPEKEQKTCTQCGETLSPSHVYCPNCGEKSSHRVFCECGDELRSDWAFCPGCGRRTPAADVLDEQ